MACRAYTVAIVSAVIWGISQDTLRIFLYITAVAGLIGVIGMACMNVFESSTEPFSCHGGGITDETFEMLEKIIERLEVTPKD